MAGSTGEQGPEDPPTPAHGIPAQPAAGQAAQPPAAAHPADPSDAAWAAAQPPSDQPVDEPRTEWVSPPPDRTPSGQHPVVQGSASPYAQYPPPGSTSGAFPRPDTTADQPGSASGAFARPDLSASPYAAQSGSPSGSFPTPDSATAQPGAYPTPGCTAFPGAGGSTPGYPSGSQAPGQSSTGQFPYGGTQTYPQPQRVAAEPKKRSGALVAGVTVLALLVGGGAGAVGGYLVADSRGGTSSTALDAPKPAQQANTPAPPGTVESVADKVLPSVVQLQVTGSSGAGEGSGFVISADGLIVTNNHVVEGAADGGRIVAVFQDGRTATATIVGRDPTSDVAVVRAEDITGLTVADLGRSDDLRVGQAVVAVGSPFELAGTVTSGIISALQRPTRAGGADGSQATVLDAVQTDAAINPGNSGGPLVNMQGQVIGINSAIYSPGAGTGDAGSVGIGFAIPIDQARRTADEIVKTGKATQTILGVTVRDNPNGGGALINEVTANGAGQKAGLAKGDVVTRLNDRRIDDADALVAAVRYHAPGDKVTLVLGDGQRTVEATLGGQPVEVN